MMIASNVIVPSKDRGGFFLSMIRLKYDDSLRSIITRLTRT